MARFSMASGQVVIVPGARVSALAEVLTGTSKYLVYEGRMIAVDKIEYVEDDET